MNLFTLNFTSNMLYLDPASTSMLMSSITAIVVACGAGIFMAWRAVKKKVKKTFHIDENANKEVEDELVLNDESTDDTTTAAADTKETNVEATDDKTADTTDKATEAATTKTTKTTKTATTTKKPTAKKTTGTAAKTTTKSTRTKQAK